LWYKDSHRYRKLILRIYIVIVKLKSFQLLLVIVVLERLHLWQLDFIVAYLNSNIDFDVYIEQSKSFIKERGNIVWKLYKILYNTMQGSHDWFKTLS